MKSAYRACAEINLDALAHNIREIQGVIGDKTDVMGVVKANAYGHGSVVLARELAKMGVKSFAVATVEEGIELRRHGIVEPILILGFVSREQYADVIRYQMMPTVFTYSMAKELNTMASALHMTVDVHIKVDTGMSRIGFKADEASVQTVVMIHAVRKNLRIQGIFTHFSCADTEEPSMTQKQMQRFEWFVHELEKNGLDIPIKHCSNSASIIDYPTMNMNMVRAGIMMYGLYPSEAVNHHVVQLQPVMQLKSRVIYVKNVEKGTPVGYGASYVCSRPTRIATVSIGYGDGYPRALSNKGRVLIANQSWPIIGRVCMDQLMVDVTDAMNEIKQGDEVVLLGNQGCESILVEELASANDSFNYEFICNVNRRIPRVYHRGGKVVEFVDYLQ